MRRDQVVERWWRWLDAGDEVRLSLRGIFDGE